MGKKLLLIVLLLAILPLVSAYETIITAQADSSIYEMTINVLDPSSLNAIKTYINDTDTSGKLTITHSSSYDKLAFSVIQRKNGKIVQIKKFGNYTASDLIFLDLRTSTSATTNPTNNLTTSSNITTSTNTTSISTTQTNNTTQNQITGNTISNQTGNTSPTSFVSKITRNLVPVLYYIGIGLAIIIGIAIVIGVVLYLVKYIKNKKPPIVKDSKQPISVSDKELANAERKIKELQVEIDRIKNKKNTLAEAERKFEEAKKELERAKRGY